MKKSILKLLNEAANRIDHKFLYICYFVDGSGMVQTGEVKYSSGKTVFQFDNEKELIKGLKNINP